MKDMEHLRLEQALKDVTADRDRLVEVVHRLQSERSEAEQITQRRAVIEECAKLVEALPVYRMCAMDVAINIRELAKPYACSTSAQEGTDG